MPDSRKHCGPHPEDQRLFGDRQIDKLRNAVVNLSWLLSRSYAADSALKLVGDRYQLDARQSIQKHPKASSDSVILNKCDKWLNLARIIIESFIGSAWILSLA